MQDACSETPWSLVRSGATDVNSSSNWQERSQHNPRHVSLFLNPSNVIVTRRDRLRHGIPIRDSGHQRAQLFNGQMIRSGCSCVLRHIARFLCIGSAVLVVGHGDGQEPITNSVGVQEGLEGIISVEFGQVLGR